jgi:dTDP-4-amino-4,6-dideoxygalactose transaminase
MTVSDAARHASPDVIFERYEDLGYNYRLTDIQGALGREQLRRLGEMVERRREQAQRYRSLLSDVPNVCPPHEPEWARSNFQSYCVRLHERLSQREVMRRMLEAGVATRRGVMCAHREPAYEGGAWRCGADAGCHGPSAGTCPHLRSSERAQDHSIVLPLFHEMTDDEQVRVVEVLSAACA